MEHQFVRHVKVLNNAGKEINIFPNGDVQIRVDYQLFYKYLFPLQFLLQDLFTSIVNNPTLAGFTGLQLPLFF